jgi:hypothetical protein
MGKDLVYFCGLFLEHGIPPILVETRNLIFVGLCFFIFWYSCLSLK